MLTTYVALPQLLLSHTTAMEGASSLLAVLLLGALGGLAWTVVRWRAQTAALQALRLEHHALQDGMKAASVRDRELSKRLEERQGELQELKQEIAVVRKKNHAAQEEQKRLREQLKAHVEERDQLLTTRPAF